MKHIKYFFQFLLVMMGFFIFKILGPNLSSKIGGKLFQKIGPLFRSTKVIHSNVKRVFPEIKTDDLTKITCSMWNNYGRVFAEYVFIKDYRIGKLTSKINIEGKEILEEIKKNNKQVIFVSGHFSNFELMAMQIEKVGINLAAIYRPLNNIYLNPVIERIRKEYICKNQIKKGIGGIKKLIKLKKKNYSTAIMIDQRVSEGILSNFFNEKAFTTTIPAQLVKKFDIPIVPVCIERTKGIEFKMIVREPIFFSQDRSIESITNELNQVIEQLIIKYPNEWIWSHNRWK